MAILGLEQLWADLASDYTDWGTYALRNFIDARRRGEPLELEGEVMPPGEGALPARPSAEAFMREKGSPWVSIQRTLADGRNNGVMRLACSVRGSTDEKSEWPVDQVITWMYDQVWPEVLQVEKSDDFTYDEFISVIRAVWRQYPSGISEARRKARGAQEQAVRGAALRVPTADAAPPTGVPPYAYTDRAPVGPYRLPPWEPVHELPASTLELKDAYLVNRIVRYVLWKRFIWARGLLWLTWDGVRWVSVDESVVRDAVREYFIYLHTQMLRDEATEMEFLKSVTGLLSQAKIAAAVKLCQGHSGAHVRDAAALDAHPDLLNTPGGVVDLRTGAVSAHNPELLLTKVTRGSYRPGYRHPDWEQALTSLDPPEREWLRMRVGQGITGHPPSDGVMPVLKGSGENGKTALTTDGPVVALGDYADMASHKLVASVTPGRSEHSTEMADLRGQRLLLGEELAEGRSIDVTALKRIQDVGMIKARLVHKDNMTFPASHTLFVTTNYTPAISETDHGTWRRLALLEFPYSYLKPSTYQRRCEEGTLQRWDREGDPGLKGRIKGGQDGQHDAVVTWAVEGAVRWYARGMADAPPTEKVEADTLDWRKKCDYIWGWLDARTQFRQAPLGGHPYCVSKDEAFDDFNAWLEADRKMPLSMETFSSRLEGHEEYRNNGLGKARTTRLSNLSRRPMAHGGLPARQLGAQVTVITGLVFKSTAETADQALAEVADPQVNPPWLPPRERFTSGSASPASPESEGPSASGNPVAESDERPAVVAHLKVPPETGENTQNAQNLVTPPKPKTPRTRLSEQEKAQRAAERKEKLARDRADARAAKVAELGGRIVQLPAIVLRDQRVAEVSADTCRQWLATALDELSVDVEHTGYPRGHKDYALRLVQLGNEGSAVVLDPQDPEQAEVISDALRAAKVLHAHSALADLIPLESAGLGDRSMWARMRDTLLAAKLTDPALCDSDEAALKPLAKALLGPDYALSWKCDELRKEIFSAAGWLTETEVTTPRERSGWANVPICEGFVRYAASDVMDCAAVWRKLTEGAP